MEKVMEAFPYKRVAVIGCPGGGKSTFSRALRDRVGLPLYHLDAIYWRSDRTTLPGEEFRAIQRQIIEKKRVDHRRQLRLHRRVADRRLRYPVLSGLPRRGVSRGGPGQAGAEAVGYALGGGGRRRGVSGFHPRL